MNKKISALLLNPSTNTQVQYLVSDPSQALLITGAVGSGKATLSLALAADMLEVEVVQDYPYFLHIKRQSGKQEISIGQVREIIAALKLRIPSHKEVQRVVFIEDAHYLS